MKWPEEYTLLGTFKRQRLTQFPILLLSYREAHSEMIHLAQALGQWSRGRDPESFHFTFVESKMGTALFVRKKVKVRHQRVCVQMPVEQEVF